MRNALLGLLTGCLLAFPAEAQQRVDLNLEEARVVASRTLLAGDAQLAIQIAEAILQAMPEDRSALLVVAAAAPRLGNPARGREAGAKAWRLADTQTIAFQPVEWSFDPRITALDSQNGQQRMQRTGQLLRQCLRIGCRFAGQLLGTLSQIPPMHGGG